MIQDINIKMAQRSVPEALEFEASRVPQVFFTSRMIERLVGVEMGE